MNKLIYFMAVGMLALNACKPVDKGERIIEKNTDFPQSERLVTSVIDNDAVFAVDEWALSDTSLVCMSSGSSEIFNVLSLPSLDLISSYGKKGSGPDEFVTPHLVGKTGACIMVMDNGRQKVADIAGDSIVGWRDIPAGTLVNRPKMLPNGDIVYLSVGQDGPYVGVLATGKDDESVLLNLSEVDSDISNLSFDVSGEYLVATSSGADRVLIHDLRSHDNTLMCGVDNAAFYYSDVVCGDDSFLLLSQRAVDAQTYDGTTVLERYAYDGSPVCEYTLDFIAFAAIYAPDCNLLVMTSPMDDDFHVADFSF